MTRYVLDSSAALRYLDGGPGAEQVENVFLACVRRQAGMLISAVQWGEIAGKLHQRLGEADALRVLGSFLPSEMDIVPATGDRAVHAAALKVDHNLAYADGFALDLAMDSPDHVLVTADYGFKPVADLVRIEFLPAN